MAYQTLDIGSEFKIKVLSEARGFDLSDYEKSDIDALWKSEQSTRASKIFHGQILNFISLEGNELIGEFVDYKFFLAQILDPTLKEHLQIKPVSISGLTLSGEKVLLGKRTPRVTQYKNFYETVPSGGIDSRVVSEGHVDLLRQYELELWEETGISVTEIKSIRPFLIVYDSQEDAYEICSEIQVNYSIVNEEMPSTEEYEDFKWLTKYDLRDFVDKNSQEFVPLSLYLLKVRRFLR
jgi:isopentenyldiphosphate isomerase